MANNHRTQRINRHKTRDPPLPRQGRGTRNHGPSTRKAEKESPLEALEQTRQFFKERGVFNLLCSGTPRHVDFEEMAEQGLGYVQGNSTKEDREQEQPFEILEDLSLLVVYKNGE